MDFAKHQGLLIVFLQLEIAVWVALQFWIWFCSGIFNWTNTILDTHIFQHCWEFTIQKAKNKHKAGVRPWGHNVKYTSICIAHLYAKCLKCAQTWITVLPANNNMPAFTPSRRTSPPFGWYSFYRPTEGRRLSRPRWLVTYRNKVPPPGVEPGHGHPSQ